MVILSPYPFAALFEAAVGVVGPMYFDHDDSVLQIACHNIAAWYVLAYVLRVCGYWGIGVV